MPRWVAVGALGPSSGPVLGWGLAVLGWESWGGLCLARLGIFSIRCQDLYAMTRH